MPDDCAARAEVVYSPGIALEPHRAALERLGLEARPLAGGAAEPALGVPVLYLIDAGWWGTQPVEARRNCVVDMQRPASAVILAGPARDELPVDLAGPGTTAAWLDTPIGGAALTSALQAALGTIALRLELAEARRELERRTRQMEEIHEVGIALSAEKNLETLQHLILRISREVTSADAGTLYLVEENAGKERFLVFQYSQNDSVDAPYQRQVMPLSTASAAGYAAVTGETLRIDDAYQLPAGTPYTFNKWFDTTFHYRTRSLLVVPMENREGTIVGVIQLINRKRRFPARLTPESTETEVEAFSAEDERVLSSFAGQAAVALENQMLLESIQRLFAGFVHASVKAIEARDPTTFGHSDRVATLTVGLAEAINGVQRDRWRDLHFTPEQLKEIEYAGLLHDFGKIGVREHVLVKPKKLYDWKLEEVRSRFRIARQQLENRYLREKLEYIVRHGPEPYRTREQALSDECDHALSDLDEALAVVLAANEPSVLEEDRFQWLVEIASRTVAGPDGESVPLIQQEEMINLSIRKGTLNEEERREIESHVTHSFNFLTQIPWTRDLQGIPSIAYAHHEKLNGSGYPRRLTADAIPIQAKMMTVADIFDALTASDRPYKLAVPLSRALDILGFEARDNCIDRDLLDLFIEKEVYSLVLPPGTRDRGRAAG